MGSAFPQVGQDGADGADGGSFVRVPFLYRHDQDTSMTLDSAAPYTTHLMSTTATPAYTSRPVVSALGHGMLNDGYIATTWDDQLANSGGARVAMVKWQNTDPLIVLDILESKALREIWVFGIGGNSAAGVMQPDEVKIEFSDNDSSWTTVENRTGLTTTDLGAFCMYLIRFDVSAAGAHRYWRYSSVNDAEWTGLSEIQVYA